MNRRSCNTPTSSTPNPSFNDWVYQGLVEQKNVLIPPSVFVATTRNSNLVQSKNTFDAGRAERWRSSRGLGRSAPITSRTRKPRSHSYRRTRTPNRQGQEQRVRTAEYTDVRVDACKTQKENVYYTRQWLLLHHYNEHRPFNVDSYDQTHDTSKQSVDELEHHNFGIQYPRQAHLQQPLQVPYPHRSSRPRHSRHRPHASSPLHYQCSAHTSEHICIRHGMWKKSTRDNTRCRSSH
jgi:hypothetical protein